MSARSFLILILGVILAGGLTVALMAWTGLPSVVLALPALVLSLVVLRARR
jgi:uncharacterized protein involved in response to NO